MRGRRSKYGAKRTEVDGVVFASMKEAWRYQYLRLLETSKQIHGLTLQPEFPMYAGKHVKVGIYRADFSYCECKAPVCHLSHQIVEDVKGFKTPVYRLKKKIVEAQYGIEIREV